MIPIEHISAVGISGDFQCALVENTTLDRTWIDFFNRAFSLYWQRALDLHGRAPQCWLPPRVQHVCVFTAAVGVNPFLQLLNKTSWSVFASDFAPESSSLEYAAYQFFHAERQALMRQVLPALVSNLSYFVTLSAEQLSDFREGCARSQRPDAEAFRALAEATEWIAEAYHQPLKQPSLFLPGYIVLPYGGLIIPEVRQNELAALQQLWASAAQNMHAGYLRLYAKPSSSRGRKIVDWLETSHPPLVIAGDAGRILWDPEKPSAFGDLMPLLGRATECAEERILSDLQVIAHHSQRFLASLRCPEELVAPKHFMTPDGLSYIHPTRKLIAYSIDGERSHQRLAEPAPPFERLMLGARTMHEWGHLSAESEWVRVAPGSTELFDALRAELAALIESLHADAPMHVRAATTMEIEQLRATSKTGSAGRLLVKMMILRSEDFQANLLAQRYLRPAEMETYVRNNVHTLATETETTGIYARLLRYAYQFQYLRLSRIPDAMAFFTRSSWFAEQFYHPGVLREEQFQQLIDLVGEICGCYAIDESKFDFATLMSAEHAPSRTSVRGQLKASFCHA